MITESLSRGKQRVIEALVPLAKMFDYSDKVRSLTQGRASWTMEPKAYAPVPDDQNFFTAGTNIPLRFVKAQTDAQGEAASQLQWLRLGPLTPERLPQFVIVSGIVQTPSAPLLSVTVWVTVNEPAER